MNLRISKSDKDHASEGLSCLSLEWILLHRCPMLPVCFSGCENRCWSKEMLEIWKTYHRGTKPAVRRAGMCRKLESGSCKRAWLLRRCEVVAGGDNARQLWEQNGWRCTVQYFPLTSGTIFYFQQRFRVDENNALHSLTMVMQLSSDGIHVMLPSATNGGREILKTKDLRQSRHRSKKLGENQALLPYLMGERLCITNLGMQRGI